MGKEIKYYCDKCGKYVEKIIDVYFHACDVNEHMEFCESCYKKYVSKVRKLGDWCRKQEY